MQPDAMRTSLAALAIIRNGNQWLLQWNIGWLAYSLIGGHLEAGESFRECCAREISEELDCAPGEIVVANQPWKRLEFTGFSRSTRVPTKYRWDLFLAQVSDRALRDLPPDCYWANRAEILGRQSDDGKPIDSQVHRVMNALSRIF